MTEDCKTDDPDATDVRDVSSALHALRDECRHARRDRHGWPDGVRDALTRVLAAGHPAPTHAGGDASAHAGRVAVAVDRVLSAVDVADLDAVCAAVDRLETLLGMPTRVPEQTVRATAQGPPGTLMR
ncbi:MAG: hypothetical protein PGN29_16245 [Gordonia paraffinivorans]